MDGPPEFHHLCTGPPYDLRLMTDSVIGPVRQARRCLRPQCHHVVEWRKWQTYGLCKRCYFALPLDLANLFGVVHRNGTSYASSTYGVRMAQLMPSCVAAWSAHGGLAESRDALRLGISRNHLLGVRV